jgi:hypothetical protein
MDLETKHILVSQLRKRVKEIDPDNKVLKIIWYSTDKEIEELNKVIFGV